MEKHDRPKEKTKLPVKFNMDSRSGKDVIVIDNSSIDNLILPSKLEIYFKEKVCLMGPNGSGKSTILKDIINNNRFGSNVVLGYIPQNIIFEDEEKQMVDCVEYQPYGDCSVYIGAFDFKYYGCFHTGCAYTGIGNY